MKFYNSRRVVYVPFNFARVSREQLKAIATRLGLDLSSFNDADALFKALRSAYHSEIKSLHPDMHSEDKDEDKYKKMAQELNSLYDPIRKARSSQDFDWTPGSGKTSQEDTAKKAREEAAKKAREEAAKKAREEAEKKAREEAARKAWEDLAGKARRAREEAARKAREESEKRHSFQEDDRFRQEKEKDDLRDRANEKARANSREEDPLRNGKGQEDPYSGAESLFKNWRETNPHWKYRQEKEKRDRWAGLGL